jgi:hypothetical protein
MATESRVWGWPSEAADVAVDGSMGPGGRAGLGGGASTGYGGLAGVETAAGTPLDSAEKRPLELRCEGRSTSADQLS